MVMLKFGCYKDIHGHELNRKIVLIKQASEG